MRFTLNGGLIALDDVASHMAPAVMGGGGTAASGATWGGAAAAGGGAARGGAAVGGGSAHRTGTPGGPSSAHFAPPCCPLSAMASVGASDAAAVVSTYTGSYAGGGGGWTHGEVRADGGGQGVPGRAVDGVMVGRMAWHRPWLMRHTDSVVYGGADRCITRRELIEEYVDYAEHVQET